MIVQEAGDKFRRILLATRETSGNEPLDAQGHNNRQPTNGPTNEINDVCRNTDIREPDFS
jgi:hypothetical protein